MKIISWNVNGIRAVDKKGEWDKFIQTYQPDIICLQETKASQDQSPVDMSEYHEFWNSSKAKKGYAGTAIFSKIKPLQVVNDIPEEFVRSAGLVADQYGDANAEGRVIAAEFDDFWLVTCYTPNAKDGLKRIELRTSWDRAVADYCAGLQKQKGVIYCGDMNVAHTPDDLARPKDNAGKKGFSDQERSGFDYWLSQGFLDSFRIFTQGNGHYTWWTHWANARARNVGWRIDYFLVSESLKDKVKKAEIHADQHGSDHCPVSVEI